MAADRKLVSYVRSCLDNGKPLSWIREELRNEGWPKKDIEDAIAAVTAPAEGAAVRENSLPETKPVKQAGAGGPKSRKLIYTVIIAAIIIGVVIFTYFTVLSLILPSHPPVTPLSNFTCGDGTCEGAETYETCPADCSTSVPANANVSINPPAGAVIAGENITFQIEISEVSNLYGFEFDLNYDPNILWFAGAEEGTFLNADNEGTFCKETEVSETEAGNHVSVACTRIGSVGGVSGSGALESLTFSAVADGTAQPTLANIKLIDSLTQQT